MVASVQTIPQTNLPLSRNAVVAYARSIPLLSADLQNIKPTILISVPRIYERITS